MTENKNATLKTLEDQGIKRVKAAENTAVTKVKAVSKPKPQLKRFTMVKNYVGALTVMLEAEDFSTPPREIYFKFDQEEKIIPVKWAIGVLVSDGALRQMEKGYFTFKELDEYIAMAEEMGHYVPDSIKEPKITLKGIKKALKTSDIQELKRILPTLNSKTKIDLITMGQNLYEGLNMEVVTLVERELGVSLKTIDLTNIE